MAIKAGKLVHVGNMVLIDRIQSGGPGNLNIPTEKIEELGNYESVATIRDIPDLTFSLESLDASAEQEAIFLGRDFESDPEGTEYDLSKMRVIDVVSQFKRGKNDAAAFDVAASAALPFLTIENLSYRFGVRDNASQSATLRGDSIFYAMASAYVEEAEGDDTEGQEIAFDSPAIPYNGDSIAGTRYALSVVLVESGKRLVPGPDYTETAAGITLVAATTETVRVVYQSLTVAEYPQVSHAAASATRPAAIKGRDIEIRIGGSAITDRWSSVQSVTAEWRVTLDRDEELGNQQIVSQDFDVPEVTGTVEIKPRDAAELIRRVKQVAGVTGDEVVGALQSVVLPIEVILHSPDDGSTLKTLYVEDARFTLPGYNGQVQQKLTVSFAFESDGGNLKVYKGARPAA
jgi:hypothetical protein